MMQEPDSGVWLGLLQALLVKAEINDVRWIGPDTSQGWDEYTVRLPRSSITIGYSSPPDSADQVAAWFHNEDDALVWKTMIDEGEDGWELVIALHWEAKRSTLKWDRTLSDLSEHLERDGVVGEAPKPSPPFDGIPF